MVSEEASSEEEPPPHLLFRRVTRSDLTSIMSIEKACFADEAFNKRQFERMLKSNSSIAFVGQLDAEIAGYIWAYTQKFGAKKYGRIYSMAVKPGFRGRGIAGNLLLLVEREMRSLQVDKIFLEVEEYNDDAKKVYSDSGFEVSGFLPDYYAPGDNALKMIKKLVYL